MSDNTHQRGLTDAQVAESREKHGQNVLTPPKREPLWKLFLEKFKDPIIRILLVAAVLSLGISIIHNEYAETIGIISAILLATGVGFWFEMDASKKFDVLNQVNDDTPVKVIRNGQITEVPKKDIVVGDIVVLETGEEIAADGELFEAISLQVNESSLTGEPVIDKTIDPKQFDDHATYPSNMALRGTTVVDGHGMMQVVRVGDATEYGKVAHEATRMSEEKTPLNKQLTGLAKLISAIGFAMAGLTFMILFVRDIFFGDISYSLQQLAMLGAVMVGLLVCFTKFWIPFAHNAFEYFHFGKKFIAKVKKDSWLKWILIGILVFAFLTGINTALGIDPLDEDSWISMQTAGEILQYFMVAVTLIVVVVPEGLPMSITLSLALSMRRMLKTNNLVRNMHASETMGAITVICTDKTGTLTQNQMRVYQTNFYGLKGQKLSGDQSSKLIEEGISANSTAFLDKCHEGKINALGNPTEGAMLLWLDSQGTDYLPLRENAKVIDQLTFSTERKFMATLVESPLLGKCILYVKGAPEIVLSRSKDILSEGGAKKSTSEYKTEIEKQLLEYQNQAMRTLGFAYKVIDKCEDIDLMEAANELTYLGIAAISDPVRPDVPAAVTECLNAGIDVKIVTGDTPATAREIARQIGVWKETDTDQNIITGVDFEAKSDEELLGMVQNLKIMCRARPTDKQRLVRLLQKKGEVVAVTGDGTNDAPALNFAHVGLSMGTGTSVAKEASDITLLDDSFASIVTAVMWGRSLYQNIQRFVMFQLTINVMALIIVLLGSIFSGEPEPPLTVTQMLWVNLIMDTFAAAALASLPPNPRVMKDKPRKSDAFIITKGMKNNILFTGIALSVVLLAAFFYITNFVAGDPQMFAYCMSAFFTLFVMFQVWNLFNAKAFASGGSAFADMKHSGAFLIIILMILVGQVAIVTVGNGVFRTVPLSLRDWLIIAGGSSLVLWAGELYRLFRRKK